MDKLEVIVDIEENTVQLGKKRVELSPPYYVMINSEPSKTSVRIEYHPNGSDYSRLEKAGRRLWDEINCLFDGTPVKIINGQTGYLPNSIMVLPCEYYNVTVKRAKQI